MKKSHEYDNLKLVGIFLFSLLAVLPISFFSRYFEINITEIYSGVVFFIFGILPCIFLFQFMVKKYDLWLVKTCK